jgi:hypothetical protein
MFKRTAYSQFSDDEFGRSLKYVVGNSRAQFLSLILRPCKKYAVSKIDRNQPAALLLEVLQNIDRVQNKTNY